MILDSRNKSKKNVNKNLLLTHWDCYTKKILYFEIGSKQVANNGNNFCNKNHQTKQHGIKRSIKWKQAKTNHEFNNFATHYHMLIRKHIHVNKQILFYLSSYYIKSFVRQLTAQTTNLFIFFSQFRFVFSPKTKTKKTNAKSVKAKLSRKWNKLGTDPPIGIGTNDINAYILFVYFCILKQGKKGQIERWSGKWCFWIVKTKKIKTKPLPAVKHGCKW